MKYYKSLSSVAFLILISIAAFSVQCNKAAKGAQKFSPFPGEAEPPNILLSSPTSGSSNLQTNQKISFMFSKPMNMDACRLAFSIVPTTLGFMDSTDITFNFTPAQAFKYGSYTYSLTKSCEDKDGRDLKNPFSASFSIGSSTSAGNNPSILGMF
ncbi:MAG: Ig-like domain-containing protein, partial [Leptospira sp.]|nr:Ig-like domain-containing protein [Leptospira sp.]